MIDCLPIGTRATVDTVTSSSSPSSIFGQAVTFTATVRDAGSGAAQNPSGTVSFIDGSTLLGYGNLVGSGTVTTATFTTSLLPEGSNKIFVVYNGNAIFGISASPAIFQTVNAVPTRTSNITVGQSISVSTFGQPVTFSATVMDTGSGTAQTPTGTVTFKAVNSNSGAVIIMGSGTLTGANGLAATSISYNAIPASPYPYTITATYNGDGVFVAESDVTNSPPLSHTVNQSPTAVVLTSSAPGGSVFGQAVSFRAAVSVPGSNVQPTGAVDFVLIGPAGQVDLGTYVMTNGVAVLTTSTLPQSPDDIIEAFYTGSPSTLGSSASISQSVSQDQSKIVLTSSTASNSPVTLTATVTGAAPGGGIPTGSVTFKIDGVVVGTGAINSQGVATFIYTTGLPRGNHKIEADYAGDANYIGTSVVETVDFMPGRGA
jgi:large repetitive protein